MTTAITCPSGFVCTTFDSWLWGTTLTVGGFVLALAAPLILWSLAKIDTAPDMTDFKWIKTALTLVGIAVALAGVFVAGKWNMLLAVGALVLLILMWIVSYALVKGLAGRKERTRNVPR